MNDCKLGLYGKMASCGSKKPRPTSYQSGYEDVLRYGKPQHPDVVEYMTGYGDACYRIKKSKKLIEGQAQ